MPNTGHILQVVHAANAGPAGDWLRRRCGVLAHLSFSSLVAALMAQDATAPWFWSPAKRLGNIWKHCGFEPSDFACWDIIPIGSMYGIYANIWGILMVNVTMYSIHGSYGIWCKPYICVFSHVFPPRFTGTSKWESGWASQLVNIVEPTKETAHVPQIYIYIYMYIYIYIYKWSFWYNIWLWMCYPLTNYCRRRCYDIGVFSLAIQRNSIVDHRLPDENYNVLRVTLVTFIISDTSSYDLVS